MLTNMLNNLNNDLSNINMTISNKISVKYTKKTKINNAYILWQNYQSIEQLKAEQKLTALKNIKDKYENIIQEINVIKVQYVNDIKLLSIKKSKQIELHLKTNQSLKQVVNAVYNDYLSVKQNILDKTQRQSWTAFLINKSRKNPTALKVLHSNIQLQYHRKRKYSLQSIKYNAGNSFGLFNISSNSSSISLFR